MFIREFIFIIINSVFHAIKEYIYPQRLSFNIKKLKNISF